MSGGTNAYVAFGAAPGLGAIDVHAARRGSVVTAPALPPTRARAAIDDAVTARHQGDGRSRRWQRRYELLPRHPLERTTRSSLTSKTRPPGFNHPVAGTTVIPVGRRVASCGGCLRRHDLAPLSGRRAPGSRSSSARSRRNRQHSARGARDRVGFHRWSRTPTQGFFDGAMDEARIWSYARCGDQSPRAERRNHDRARTARRDGASTRERTVLADSSGNAINGTVTGPFGHGSAGAPVSAVGNTAPVASPTARRRPRRRRPRSPCCSNDTDADAGADADAALACQRQRHR